MKSRICVLVFLFSFPYFLYAQDNDNIAYAITSEIKGTFEWTEVKKIDLSNGEVIRNVFENSKGEYNIFDARTSARIPLNARSDDSNDNLPFAGLSAACAYDKKYNRLYYAPIFLNQLRYIDLNAKISSVYIFRDRTFSNAVDLQDEANHITRMVIAADGNGYALNNDGSHLVKFTTGEIPEVQDLGAVEDAPANGDVSVKDANTSWGGDLIADINGNLYLITAHNYVFRIDLHTKVATFVREIKHLPQGFTSNGAVVDKGGNIILSSANFLTTYFSVDPSNWEAEPLPVKDNIFNTSDLANNNFLYSAKLPEIPRPATNGKPAIFPNPVPANVFKVNFGHHTPGRYNIVLMDMLGKTISVNPVVVTGPGQVSEVKVNPSLTRGTYVVKVLNPENKEVFLKKIILQ